MSIKTTFIDDKECCLFLSHFFVMTTNFQASLLTSERCLFTPKDCFLGCSNGSNQLGDHDGIC